MSILGPETTGDFSKLLWILTVLDESELILSPVILSRESFLSGNAFSAREAIFLFLSCRREEGEGDDPKVPARKLHNKTN